MGPVPSFLVWHVWSDVVTEHDVWFVADNLNGNDVADNPKR
jgi:hypothetical protein